MLVTKNKANNTMYIVEELNFFINIQWNCIQWNCIQSLIIKHFISINIFTTLFNYFISTFTAFIV